MATHRVFAHSKLAWLSLASVAVACGGSPPAPQAPSGAASSSAVVVTPQPQVDLSQVPEPQGLVVSGRIAKLSASFDVVHGWSKLPMPGAEQVTELLTSEAVGGLADLDQPIDFAVAVVGKFPKVDALTAVSAAVKDPEKAKASLAERYKLVPGANGVVLIQGLGRPAKSGSDDDDDDGKDDHRPKGDPERTCELAPAFGAAPTRLVCAWSTKALGELAPWLTRTATRAPSSTADAHVDVPHGSSQEDMLALGAPLLAMARLAEPSGPVARACRGGDLLRASIADMLAFAKETSVLSLDLQLGDPGATTTATLKLASANSQMAHMATAHPERSGPPPAAFWQLPGDADQAVFSRGIDAADVAKMTTARPAHALDRRGRRERHQGSGPQGHHGRAHEADVRSRGGLRERGGLRRCPQGACGRHGSHERAVRRSRGHHGGQAPTASEAILGWRIIERDEVATRVSAALHDLTAAWNKPSVLAGFRTKHPDGSPPSLRSAPLPKAVALPAGSVHYLIELNPPAADSLLVSIPGRPS